MPSPTHLSDLFRRLLALSLAVALGLTATLLAPATAEAASPKHAVSVSLSAAKVTSAGAKATVRGTVKNSATRKAVRTKVTLQARVAGTSKWRSVRTVTSSRNGAFEFKYAITKNTQFRVTVAATKRTKSQVSPVRTTQASQSLTVSSVAPRSLDVGRAVTIRGSASAALRGTTVRLQLLSGRNWVTLASSRISQTGAFSVSAPINQAGAGVKLRVHAGGTAALRGVAAGAGAVNVYRWYWVKDLNRVDDYFSFENSARINGNLYANTINLRSYGSTFAQYDLARKCTHFSAVVGLTDTSKDQVRMQPSVWRDDAKTWTGPIMKVGQQQNLTLDVTGTLRIKLAQDRYSNTDWSRGVLGFGNAKVRCLTNPNPQS